MIIMDLKLQNVLGFKDIHFNFSYPRKIKNNTLGNECLKGIPNFRYKKVNIIMGSNSNGKSSLGIAIWKICMFLRNKESSNLFALLSDQADFMNIDIDYVSRIALNRYVLNRVRIRMEKEESSPSGFDIRMDYENALLRNDDTYESACLNLAMKAKNKDYIECLNDISCSDGWFISMPITETGFDDFVLNLDAKEREVFSKVLFKTLVTLDPNIQSVNASSEIDDAYIVKYDDGKNTLVKSGDKISDIRYLSSGTKYGFLIAKVFYFLGKHKNGLFYVDELFSYINSDLEIAMLNTMISMLGDCEQLFFTTHNSEVLLLPFPLHSFLFLGKKKENGIALINYVCASDVEKRNNVVIKNLYDNDAFDISPDTKEIFEIEGLFENGKK